MQENIGKAGQTYMVSIRLINVGTGAVIKQMEEEVRGTLDDVLTVGIYNAARKMAGLAADKKVRKREAAFEGEAKPWLLIGMTEADYKEFVNSGLSRTQWDDFKASGMSLKDYKIFTLTEFEGE